MLTTVFSRMLGLAACSFATAALGCGAAPADAETPVAQPVPPVEGSPLDASRRNLADFDWVVSMVAQNYSGWENKTSGTRRCELEAVTLQLRNQIATGDDAAAREAMEQWLAWFDDGHLRLDWTVAENAPAWNVPPRGLDEAEARATMARFGADLRPIEGLWTIDDRYRLAVLRRDGSGNVFDAVVLSSAAETWAPGDVKAVLTEQSDGTFGIRYGAGDRTEIALRGKLVSGNDVLEVAGFGVWRRSFDDPAAAEEALRRWPGEDFTISRVDSDTLYLRLPSFGDAHTDTVRKLIEAQSAELATTPQLIIDLRGNTGGSDFVYAPVLPLLYTRPIWRIGVEVRVSADNARLRREEGERLAAVSAEASRTLIEESDRMAGATVAFIRREPPIEVVRLEGVLMNPARIAVLIDRAGSSAENFIMDARQSRKVTLVGQENSAGVIDYGEMMGSPAPSARFTLLWATTRSLRLPGDPVDPQGIAPDVLIPKDVEDPVMWAAEWLRRK